MGVDFAPDLQEKIPTLFAIVLSNNLLWERLCKLFPQHKNWVNVLGGNFPKINTLPPIPTFDDFFEPVIQALKDLGGSGTVQEITDQLSVVGVHGRC